MVLLFAVSTLGIRSIILSSGEQTDSTIQTAQITRPREIPPPSHSSDPSAQASPIRGLTQVDDPIPRPTEQSAPSESQEPQHPTDAVELKSDSNASKRDPIGRQSPPAVVRRPPPDPIREQKPLSTQEMDRVLTEQLRSQARSVCKPEYPTTITFQILPSGRVPLATASPKNDCIESEVEKLIFPKRTAPKPVRLEVQP
jgi:hypothetical protein